MERLSNLAAQHNRIHSGPACNCSEDRPPDQHSNSPPAAAKPRYLRAVCMGPPSSTQRSAPGSQHSTAEAGVCTRRLMRGQRAGELVSSQRAGALQRPRPAKQASKGLRLVSVAQEAQQVGTLTHLWRGRRASSARRPRKCARPAQRRPARRAAGPAEWSGSRVLHHATNTSGSCSSWYGFNKAQSSTGDGAVRGVFRQQGGDS